MCEKEVVLKMISFKQEETEALRGSGSYREAKVKNKSVIEQSLEPGSHKLHLVLSTKAHNPVSIASCQRARYRLHLYLVWSLTLKKKNFKIVSTF